MTLCISNRARIACFRPTVRFLPIFKTQNKGQPLGIDFLEKLNPKNYQAEIFALGGIIGAKEVEAISKTSIKNFASIRYFLS